MKKLLTNLAFIFACTTAVIAQADYRKGYVVKLNGDTLFGFVNFQKEAVNNSTCNFKRFDIAIPVNYSPEKLKAYGVFGGKQYLSANIHGKQVFIEYLVKGKISLLYLNRGGEHFYIYSENSKLVELKAGKTLDPNDNQVYDRYKDFLSEKLKPGDYSALIQNSRLDIRSLVGIIKSYNEQLNYAFVVPERPKGKSMLKDYNLLGTNKIHLGIMGGASFYKFSPVLKSSKFFYMTNADFGWDTSPIGGIFLKWNVSRVRPQWSFQTNLMYNEVSLYGYSEHLHPLNSNLKLYDDVFFDYKELKIQFLVNYSLLRSNFNILPHIGIGTSKRFNPTFFRFYEELNTTTNIVKSSEFRDVKIKSTEYAAIGGITLEYKLSDARSVFMNLDYEYGSKLVDVKDQDYYKDLEFKPRGTTINITLGITL